MNSFFKLPGLILFFLISCIPVFSQQFNSDSYLSKPHGMITIIPTYGERNSMLMNTFSLFSRWEFTIAAYLYNNDGDPLTDDGYSTSFFFKYMIYENPKKTGGFAIKAGTGMFPGTLGGTERERNAFKTYWMNTPATLPFFDNKLQVDLMPGVSVTRDYQDTKSGAWAFTYSARVAYYIDTKWSMVGEVFGSEGETRSIPEFKAGPRWEPSQYAVFALTYGHEFNGTEGAGFEAGVMLFTPAFAQLKLKKKKAQ